MEIPYFRADCIKGRRGRRGWVEEQDGSEGWNEYEIGRDMLGL